MRTRILQGSYAIKPLPSERRLAKEFGVNYMTVRRGLTILEEEGLLIRRPNRRKQVKLIQHGAKPHLNIGFVMPTRSYGALKTWRDALENATDSRPISVRPILYLHWEDPILRDALEGFDGVFLSPVPEPVPDSVAAALRDPRHPVVVLDQDFSNHGVPSIRIFPPVFVQRLLDHLEALGHACIGCFNTHPDNSEVRERIDQWRFWMAVHGFSGRLVNSSVSPTGHQAPAGGDPMQHAYDLMKEILSKPGEETAWFFVTAPAAIGAMRAILDHGLMPGKDIAVCTANGENLAKMSNPRLTALEPSDPGPLITYCLDWMTKGRQHWEGPLLMQPAEVPLIIRESTQPSGDKRKLLLS